jgi:hypothetical protein
MTSGGPERLTSSEALGRLTGSPEGKPARFRISRPCYDKPHRCPGWAGGGVRYARFRRCDSGYISHLTGDEHRMQRLWQWRVYRCPKCRVWVLPYMTRWLDPGWWGWKADDWTTGLDRWLREHHDLRKTRGEWGPPDEEP